MGNVEITLTASIFKTAMLRVGAFTEASRLYVEEFEQAGKFPSQTLYCRDCQVVLSY